MEDGRAGIILAPGHEAAATPQFLLFAIAIIHPQAVEEEVVLVPDQATFQGLPVVVRLF